MVGYSSATLVCVVAVHAASLVVGVVVVVENHVRVLLPVQSDCVVLVRILIELIDLLFAGVHWGKMAKSY